MDIKRGSVTPVDLTGQADGDYIRNDGGIYKPRTTDELTRDVLFNKEWQILPKDFFTQTAFTGTAAWHASADYRLILMRTNATAGSTARVSSGGVDSWAANIFRVNWEKLNIIEMRVTAIDKDNKSTANSKKWVYWGDISTDAVGDPTRKGIGIRVDHNAIKGLAHDGTTLHEVALATALGGPIVRQIRIISLNGTVQWYVDGSLEGSTTDGPAGYADANYESCIRMYLTNGTDAADNYWSASPFKVYADF